MLAQLSEHLGKEELFNLTIGERDQLLIKAYQAMFGSEIEVFSSCSACSCELELLVDLNELLVVDYEADTNLKFELHGKQLLLEPIRVGDLKQVKRIGNEKWLDEKLTQGRIAPKLITQEDRNEYAARLSELDPQADICLEFECVECQFSWIDPFDIASQLWLRFDATCKRLLAAVHSLASAYGWTETEVLAMSPWRREVYLNMVRAS